MIFLNVCICFSIFVFVTAENQDEITDAPFSNILVSTTPIYIEENITVTEITTYYDENYSTTDASVTTTNSSCDNSPFIESASVNTTCEISKATLYINLQAENDKLCQDVDILVNCENHLSWNFHTKKLQNNFTLDRLHETTNYTCSININGNSSSSMKSISFMTAGPSIENITINKILQKEVNVTIKMSSDDRSTCLPIKMNVRCEGFDNSYKTLNEYTFTIENETTFVELKNLTDFTIYTCDFRIEESNKSKNISFITEAYAPWIKNISINELQAKNVSFTISLTIENGTHFSPVDILLECITNDSWDWIISKKINDTIEANNLSIHYTLNDLAEYTEYNCLFSIESTNEQNVSFTTDQVAPTEPENLTVSTNTFFALNISWNIPKKVPTILKGYNVTIERYNPGNVSINCTNGRVLYYSNFTEETEFFFDKALADSKYTVQVSAWTTAGEGQSSTINVTTPIAAPEFRNLSKSITNKSVADKYNVICTIEITPGCFNGPFNLYHISWRGNRTGYSDEIGNQMIQDYNDVKCQLPLFPEHFYVVNVTIGNTKYNTTKSIHFHSPDGVPIFNNSIISNIVPVSSKAEATLTLHRKYFNEDFGKVQFLAIIVSTMNTTAGDFYDWNPNSQWPMPTTEEPNIDYYQATPPFWTPFKDSDVIDYKIGTNRTCSKKEQFCNKPLSPGQTYYVFFRIFTMHYYRNSMPIKFVTQAESRVWLIVGIILGVLVCSLVGFVGFQAWRRGYIKKFLAKEDLDSETERSRENFIVYCHHLQQNPHVLNKQWQDLEIKSQEVYDGAETHFALLPENRRKNRFINILPFDHSRVKLNIDEDDEICSDYINASYIKGFSNRTEYIATQGPLPHTVRDFWKMVFQENVSIIVMVSRFIESKKEKCYKYFPNNHETILFGDDLEVRCSVELYFQIHCVRTLQVRKGNTQITVTHMQFLEWPDFGVPEGTNNLLTFCHQLRERWVSEGGMAVVHCSAGVGRTGTIIAIDILTQAIRAGRKIDVYNTVLNLRRERKGMVQTEKQYMYIYQLVKSVLEDPLDDIYQCNGEHIYENVEKAAEVLVETPL